ncbi:MAG: HDOD domain-containing protein [Kangiellaceae bacterium]|nr:HDOD domain-containing protein [Kangiellaceae bacterium]
MKQLDDFALPVCCDLPAVIEVLSSDDSAPGDVLNLIKDDPVFCLYVQKAAGSKQKNKIGEVHGVEHALSMMGVDSVLSLAKQLKTFTGDEAPEVKQVLAESLLAYYIAEQLADFKTTPNKELTTSAMFHRTNEWLMYWLHPRKSWQLRRLKIRRPFTSNTVSEAFFDFKLSDFQFSIAENYFLPNLSQRIANFNLTPVLKQILQAVKLFRADDLRLEECSRELRLYIGAPEMTSVIANQLAQAVCSPWLRNQYGHWISIAAIHCHQKESTMVKALLSAIRKVSINQALFSQFGLASGILSQTSETPYAKYLPNKAAIKSKIIAKKSNRLNQQPVTNQSVTNILKETVAKPIDGNTVNQSTKAKYLPEQITQIRGYLRKLVDQPESFDSVQKVVSRTLEKFIKDSPLERISFIAIGKDGQVIKSLMTQAKRPQDGFTIKGTLAETQVWQKFLPKPNFLLFTHEKHAKYWPTLPAAIKEDNRINYFLFNSISYGGKVKAFLYADMVNSGLQLPPDMIQDFKRLAAAMSAAIKYHIQNK